MGEHKHSALKREVYRHQYRDRMRTAVQAQIRSIQRTAQTITTETVRRKKKP